MSCVFARYIVTRASSRMGTNQIAPHTILISTPNVDLQLKSFIFTPRRSAAPVISGAILGQIRRKSLCHTAPLVDVGFGTGGIPNPFGVLSTDPRVTGPIFNILVHGRHLKSRFGAKSTRRSQNGSFGAKPGFEVPPMSPKVEYMGSRAWIGGKDPKRVWDPACAKPYIHQRRGVA